MAKTNQSQKTPKNKPFISEESSFSKFTSLETHLVGNFHHLIKQVIETLMIFNLLHLIVSWGLLHHLSLQDLHLPAWLMSKTPRKKRAVFLKENPLHFSKTVGLKHCKKYTGFFPPPALCLWKQAFQALDSRETEDRVDSFIHLLLPCLAT